jgi:flagellar biosynthesis protein FlhF
MLVGPPGAGKTVALAKIAAQLALNGDSIYVISTDSKAGATEQLNAYLKPLGQGDVIRALSPKELKSALKAAPIGSIVLIDTMGTNPYDSEDLELLGEYVVCLGKSPVLVLPSGIDALEAQDVTQVFQRLGVTSFIATRFDLTRRLGGVLSCVVNQQMNPLFYGDNPHIGAPLHIFTAKHLADKLIEYSSGHKDDAYG